MELQFSVTNVALSATVIALATLFLRLFEALVAKPRRLRSALEKQGIGGPKPTLILGNILQIKKARDRARASSDADIGVPDSHNCGAKLLPFIDEWRRQFGDVHVFSLGNKQILCVTQPEMVREMTTYTSLDLGKPTYQAREMGSLLGQGILTSNGAIWAHQRKILAPELYMEKVKGMIKLVQESTTTMINTWHNLIDAEGGIADIEICKDMRSFSGDVISKACFGSSYTRGEEIFLKLRALQEVTSKRSLAIGIPGMRKIPTKINRETWALEKEVKTLILRVVKERTNKGESEKDLLQMVLEGAQKSDDLSQDAIDRFVVDNCKNIYLAGYETTAVAASWCLMLLASNPDWQQRVRDEVVEICHGQIPDADLIRKMKQLTMVIYESLRLYPPVSVVSREALKNLKFGNVNIPKGVNVWTMVTTLHTDTENWGSDAYQFNPERFANGISSSCKMPHLYMPFGVGPRMCLGQNLAMVELKILISLILTNFSILISPKYKHSPSLNLVIEPGFGVNLLVKKL